MSDVNGSVTIDGPRLRRDRMAMSTTLAFRRDLIDLVRARYPILLVETHEERRVVDIVLGAAADPVLRRPRAVQAYSMSTGLQPVTPSAAARADRRAETAVAALQSAAQATEPTIFVFFDLHHALSGAGGKAEPLLVRHLLDVAGQFKNGPVPHTLLIVAPQLTIPSDLEKVVTVLELPLPDEGEISLVLDDIVAVNAASIVNDLDAEGRQQLVRAALGLTLDEAENAFARAIAGDRRLDTNDIALVHEEKRQTIRKSGLLEYISAGSTPSDVGGLDNLKRWLEKRNGAWLSESAEWSITAPRGVLITGVPGCGKSLTAKTMSAMWNLPLLRLDVGRIFAGIVGSSEQNMRGALRLAEAVAPSILWIDEIEKGFGSQGSGDSGTSTRVFGTFLTWMQEKSKPVFVIATANKIDALPPELLRKGRFDEIFFVDLPTHSERGPIWRVHLRRRISPTTKVGQGFVVTEELIERLARASEGFSGAEIEQVVVSAGFDAFAARRPLIEDDLFHSIESTVPLSVTQSEEIIRIREWAEKRAVAATAPEDLSRYARPTESEASDVSSWRGGRAIDF